LQELDRIQARGQSGAKSPLLWDEGQVATLLQGSPIVAEVAERLHVRAPAGKGLGSGASEPRRSAGAPERSGAAVGGSGALRPRQGLRGSVALSSAALGRPRAGLNCILQACRCGVAARGLVRATSCAPAAPHRLCWTWVPRWRDGGAQGIEREYDELDTVWFMAGSLFRNYPYDVPTEAFSLQIFRQARPCRAPAQRTAGMQGGP
jgi:hypothetical protein